MKKGSLESKRHMAHLRSLRRTTGTGIGSSKQKKKVHPAPLTEQQKEMKELNSKIKKLEELIDYNIELFHTEMSIPFINKDALRNLIEKEKRELQSLKYEKQLLKNEMRGLYYPRDDAITGRSYDSDVDDIKGIEF